MEKDELRDDILDNDTETVEEEIVDTDEVDTDDSDDTDDVDALRAEAAKWKAIALRNKKKQTQVQAAPVAKQEQNTNNLRDEVILIAQGYTEEDVEQLSLVAKGAGISLREAKEHPLFQTYMEKQNAEKRTRKATLGAGKGSPAKKSADYASMTEDDHRNAWLGRFGNV